MKRKLIVTLLAFLGILLILYATANADVHKLACTNGRGIAYGTAVSVGTHPDGRTVLFTAAHCVAGNRNGVEVAGSGTWHKAEVVDSHVDGQVDFAILFARVKCNTLATIGPTPSTGDKVAFTGWSNGRRYERKQAAVSAWTDSGKLGFWTRGDASIDGQSGGPCWDGKGRLVGILSGGAGQESTFTSVNYMQTRWRKVCTPFG